MSRKVILSAPVLIGEGSFKSTFITLEQALGWANVQDPVNYSSHETTKIVGIEPSKDRITCSGYDEALILIPNESLEFGREYSLEEIELIGVKAQIITRIG